SLRSMAGKRIMQLTPKTRYTADRKGLRGPCEEVLDQLQTKRLALFRVELGAENVVATNAGGERTGIVCRRNAVLRTVRPQVIGVDEIGVQPIGAIRNASEQRMRTRHRNCV